MTSESADVPINSENRLNSLALRIPYILNASIKLRASVLEVYFEETK